MGVQNLDCVGFKYKVGDMLMASVIEKCGVCTRPIAYVVDERIAQECPGGVQLFYRVTSISNDGDARIIQLMEHQLIPYRTIHDEWKDLENQVKSAHDGYMKIVGKFKSPKNEQSDKT